MDGWMDGCILKVVGNVQQNVCLGGLLPLLLLSSSSPSPDQFELNLSHVLDLPSFKWPPVNEMEMTKNLVVSAKDEQQQEDDFVGNRKSQ